MSDQEVLVVEGTLASDEPLVIDTRYMWEAVYDNGESSLLEWVRAEDGTVKKYWFHDIDTARTTAFILHDLIEPNKTVVVKLSPEQRLIFFRRYKQELNLNGGGTIYHEPIHVIGYQQTVTHEDFSKNVSTYLAIYPDGSFLLSDDHTQF